MGLLRLIYSWKQVYFICNYFSHTSGEAAFTTRCLNLDLHHMMQFKCRDYILVFFYTWNYSECGATHNGIFKYSLQGGSIFCSSLAADPKQISIWAYFCRTQYMLKMYSILGKTFWRSVDEGKRQILTSCCNLFAIVLFDNVFFSNSRRIISLGMVLSLTNYEQVPFL